MTSSYADYALLRGTRGRYVTPTTPLLVSKGEGVRLRSWPGGVFHALCTSSWQGVTARNGRSRQQTVGSSTPSTKGKTMSIAIDIGKVEYVLIAGKWHRVVAKSFDLDAYEFIQASSQGDRDQEQLLLGGGVEKLIPATGFIFTTSDDNLDDPFEVTYRMAGPLTSIQAVRYGTKQRKK